MIAHFLAVLLCVPLRAQTPNNLVDSVMKRVEALVASQKGKDAGEIKILDHRAEDLSKELAPIGWKAVPALTAAAQDLKRPPKVRLFAASFLALTRDPSALAPLEDILLNGEQAPFVRALAAQSLPGLGAPDAVVSKSLCGSLRDEHLPREVLTEVLIALKSLGCEDSSSLARIARSFGPRPDPKDFFLVSAAITALGSSRGIDSGSALLELVSYFPPQENARASAIMALGVRRADIAAWLKPRALPVVLEALRSESPRWDSMIPLIRLAAALGGETLPAISRLSAHPDAEVLAEAAEALSGLKHVAAIPALETVAAGAMNDPRFSPIKNRPDPAVSLARIEKAIESLRRAR